MHCVITQSAHFLKQQFSITLLLLNIVTLHDLCVIELQSTEPNYDSIEGASASFNLQHPSTFSILQPSASFSILQHLGSFPSRVEDHNPTPTQSGNQAIKFKLMDVSWTYLAIKVMCTAWQDKVAGVVGRPGEDESLLWLVSSGKLCSW